MRNDAIEFVEWPGVSAAYSVPDRPALVVAISFDPAAAEICDEPLPLFLWLKTSLWASVVPFTDDQLIRTFDWIQAVRAHLLNGVAEPPSALELEFAVDAQTINADSIFEFTVSIGDTPIPPASAHEAALGLERVLDRKIALDPESALWVVRPSSLRVLPAAPSFFAPRPLANRALSDSAVPIWPYQAGALLDFSGPPVPTAFASVDLDEYGRLLTGAVDQVVSPDLTRWKPALAQRFSDLMAPVFAGQRSDPDGLAAAREAYRRAMLAELANAYSVTSAVAFRVQLDAPLPAGEDSLELVGLAHAAGSSVPPAEAALDLRSGAEQSLACVIRVDPAAAAHIDAQWSFQPDGILTGGKRLTFAVPPAPIDLGGATAPLPLRAVPSPPALLSQRASAATVPDPPSLEQLLRWDYSVDYELVHACPQDQVHLSMSAGSPSSVASSPIPDSLFHALVQFAAVYPALRDDLDAPAALASFDNLVARVVDAWPRIGRPPIPRLESLAGSSERLVSLNIIVHRSARCAAFTTRNAQLLLPDPRATAPEFVYTTPSVTFPTPCFPYLDRQERVDLAEVPRRTLAAYLTNFFDRLLGPDPAALETGLSAEYEFEVAPGLPAALPLFLLPPTASRPDPTAIEQFVRDWLQTNQPRRDGGALRFDVTVASTATGAPLPLLRLRNVHVRLTEIADPTGWTEARIRHHSRAVDC